jgi:hypothetical protein
MVHTTPEIATSNLILDFEFDQHLESHKHVISIIMRFRDTGCYMHGPCGVLNDKCTCMQDGGVLISVPMTIL